MRSETIARRAEPIAGVPFPDPHPRIPALISSHVGLVLAYDVRPSPLDLPGPQGIAYHVLEGNSWSELRQIRQQDEWGYGDASLVVLPDRILCFYVSSRSRSFWDDTDPSNWHIWLSSSTDGVTWEHRNLTDSLWDDRRGLVLRTIAPEKLVELSTMLQDGTYSSTRSLWSDPVVLDDGPAAYSVVISTPEGLAVAWEHGAYESIEFALLSPSDIHY